MNAIFVGSGSISRRHLRNWQSLIPGGRCSFVARSRPEDLESSVSYFESLETALAEGADCVFLSNPSVFHLKSASLALRAGCHVFCEKPLSHSLEGVSEVMRLAEEHRRVLFVGYNLRFHACLQEIHSRVQSGVIGELLTLFLEVGQALPEWRPHMDYRKSVSARKEFGGGALLELSHEIDAALWLAGKPLHKGFAKAGQTGELEIDVEDYASLILDFKGGATAMVHIDFIQRPGGRRYRLIGSKGSLDWNSKENSIKQTSFDSGKIVKTRIALAEDSNHSYLAQMLEFIRVLKDNQGNIAYSVGAFEVLKCLNTLDFSENHV